MSAVITSLLVLLALLVGIAAGFAVARRRALARAPEHARRHGLTALPEDPLKTGFLESGRIAVVGVSAGGGFGTVLFKELKKNGYPVVPVSRTAREVEGVACVESLDAVEPRPDAVLICVPPAAAEEVVRDCARLGIGRIWLQQGAESEGALRVAREEGLAAVAGACALMYARPALPHRMHGWVWRRLGRF